MTALGDVLVYTITQTLLDQVVRNVFGYVVTTADVATPFENMLIPLEADIFDTINDIQHTAVLNVDHRLLNLNDLIEDAEGAVAGGGTNSTGGPVLPSYVAMAYRLVRGDTDTRNGSKRFAGAAEDAVTNNDWSAFGGVAALALETAIAANVVATIGTMTISPVIIGRNPITGGFDTARISPVIEAAAQQLISTQNSRKAGRGE